MDETKINVLREKTGAQYDVTITLSLSDDDAELVDNYQLTTIETGGALYACDLENERIADGNTDEFGYGEIHSVLPALGVTTVTIDGSPRYAVPMEGTYNNDTDGSWALISLDIDHNVREDYTVEADVDWITDLAPDEDFENYIIKFKISKNETGADRSGNITITLFNQEFVIPVDQDGTNDNSRWYAVADDWYTIDGLIDAAGCTDAALSITQGPATPNTLCTAVLLDEVDFAAVTAVDIETDFTLTVDANTAYAPRAFNAFLHGNDGNGTVIPFVQQGDDTVDPVNAEADRLGYIVMDALPLRNNMIIKKTFASENVSLEAGVTLLEVASAYEGNILARIKRLLATMDEAVGGEDFEGESEYVIDAD